jgi:predicted nucleic acid-binding protein
MTSPIERSLLDTSAWALYLRMRGPSDLKAAVREELDNSNVVTCWVVRSELLVGSRDAEAFAALLDMLTSVPDIPITTESWIEASRLGYSLRKQGLRVGLPDLLIAQCALSHRCVLWHSDSDFESVRRFTNLRTRHWPTQSPN